MEHQFFKDRLSAYFDHELKNEEHAIVQQHIEGCDECQAELKQLDKLENLFAEKSELSDNDYWETSAQKIEAALEPTPKAEIVEIAKPKSKGLWWKLTGVAASLTLVAIIAFEENNKSDELLLEDSRQESISITADSSGENIGHTKVDSFPTFHKEIIKRAANDTLVKPIAVRGEEKTVIVLDSKETVDELQPQPKPAKPIRKQVAPKSQAVDQAPAPVEENLRNIEFENSGVETATASDNILSQSKEKKEALSIRGGRAEEVEIAEQSKVVAEELAESIQSNILKKSAPAMATSLVPQSDDADESLKTQKAMSNNTELNYWRRKIAEDKELLKTYSKQSIQYMKPTSKDSSKKKNKSAALDIGFTYNQIFEAYYHVALLTNDSLEEKLAVDYLIKYADSLTGSYSSNALYYLQLYKLEKTQKESRENK